MFCKRWRPEELLPKADLLSFLLLLNPHVTGVALTGSLARKKSKIHDVDLVVLHDGSIEDGSAQDPECTEPYYNNDLILPSVLAEAGGPEFLSRSLSQARNGIPVNYIFVGERVLWDCEYLQSLEKQENFPGFYLRVFTNIPLILLDPYHARGALRGRFFDKEKVFAIDSGLRWTGLSYSGLRIGHQCTDPRCRPKQSWSECQRDIKQRKGHWWHS